MPIRINLLAESQAAEEMRRKDPVKRAVWIGGFLVALVAIWAMNIQFQINALKNKYNNAERSWDAKKLQYSSVTNFQARTWDMQHKLDTLDNLHTNRFLWAPVLNALQKTVLNEVTVTQIKGEQNYRFEEGKKYGKACPPPVTTESIKISIDGRDTNPSEQGYNKYKEALNKSSYFADQSHRQDSFVVDGTLGPLNIDPNDPTHQFKTFTLATHFPDKQRTQ